MTARTRIAAYDSRDGRFESVVTLTERGNYAVTILDLDAAETLPAARHFKTEDAARDYAIKCVTIPGDDDMPF